MKFLEKYFLSTFPYLIVFLSSLYQPYDTDLGWHMKYGEYFFKHFSILKDNIFSTDMQGFHWINSSWITDLVSYISFNFFGFLGLAVLAALVITLTFYFFSKAFKLNLFEQALIFPIVLYTNYPINRVSFRGQLLSLLLLGILVYLVKQYEDHKSKKIFLLVPLFLIWSNVHGQFLLGLATFAIWEIFYLLSQVLKDGKDKIKKVILENKALFIVAVLSVIAVIVNPFGIGVYLEAIKHFRNPFLKDIVEWLPLEELSNYWWQQVLLGFLLFFGALYIVFGKMLRKHLPWLGISSIYYFMTFLVRRYAWSMHYLVIPILKPVAQFLKPESEKISKIAGAIILFIYFGFVMFLDNPFQRVGNMSWESYCKEFNQCSIGAMEFLKENKDQYSGTFMSFYDWGGFMIWNYPEVKPSIDGRMHLWRDENGYSAFEQYYPVEQDLKDIQETDYQVVLMSPKKPVYDRLMSLVDSRKWNIVYHDKYGTVFVRR